MKTQQVGTTEIRRVSEIDRLALEAAWLFPAVTPAHLEENRDWLGANLIEPDSSRLYMSFHSFVIRTRHHTILVDTCNGNHKQRPSMPAWHELNLPYLENLAAIGVHPDEVDIVMCTHLHADHVGWNTRLLDGRWVPTFPNARYIMSRVDYEHFHRLHLANPEQPVNRGSFVDSVLPVVDHGLADMVEMNHSFERELGEGVWLEPAPGHSPGHVCVHVGKGDAHAVLSGDVIHHPIQFADPSLCNAADFDTAQSTASRLALMRQLADTSSTLLTGHFPTPTAGRVVSHGDRFRFRFES
jgi:glyoxylase-like metal-dependent hydrolase (beta-lactamase superfamily II)